MTWQFSTVVDSLLGTRARPAKAHPWHVHIPRSLLDLERCSQPYGITCLHVQGVNAASVPKPTGSGVSISNLPALDVYVLPYGGFSSAAMEHAKADELIKKLQGAKEPFDAKYWFTAGYDSPYTLVNRHNEVWIPKAAAAGASSTASATGSKAAAGR